MSWSSTVEDPATFALQLYEIYYDQLYTVSDDVVTSLESLTFTVPVVSQGCVLDNLVAYLACNLSDYVNRGAWTLRAINSR